MSSTRTRVTTTIRHDNPVPKKRKSRKKSGAVGIVLIALAVLLGIAVAKNGQHAPHVRAASIAR
jgi:uncharacterized protein HemX